MAQISLEIPDELLEQLAEGGRSPAEVLQERLVAFPVALGSASGLSQRFQVLADQWRRETGHLSLMSDIVLNTAYQQIIGMGRPAIALILQDLSQQPDHWFWALRSRSVAKAESITGENPVQVNDRGRLPQMAEAWLVWGRANGYQC
jgi:hypothetical protein